MTFWNGFLYILYHCNECVEGKRVNRQLDFVQKRYSYMYWINNQGVSASTERRSCVALFDRCFSRHASAHAGTHARKVACDVGNVANKEGCDRQILLEPWGATPKLETQYETFSIQ